MFSLSNVAQVLQLQILPHFVDVMVEEFRCLSTFGRDKDQTFVPLV